MEDYRRGDLRIDRYRKNRRRRSPAAIIIILILIFAIAGICIFTYIKKNTTYTSYKVTKSRELENEETTKYMKHGTGYIRYTGDGAEAVNGDGSTNWNISYIMKLPIADECGESAVFADRGYRTVCVTDGTGISNIINVPDEIVDVRAAKQGVSAVWTNGGDKDHIYVYDFGGTMLLDIETKSVKDGFPIDIALSPDGRKLVTSYMIIGEDQENWLTFYNFGDVGQNYSDRIVGSFSFGAEIVPNLEFIGNDYLCAFTEKGFSLYKFRELPELEKEEVSEEKVLSISTSEKRIGLIINSGKGSKTIKLYNENGNKTDEFKTGIEYSSFVITDSEVILHNSSTGLIYTFDGEEKLKADFNENIRFLYSGNDEREYIMVSDRSIETIRLITAKEEEEAAKPD